MDRVVVKPKLLRKKKVLIINWRDVKNPEAGGAEIYYHEIFKRLARKGEYEFTVLSHFFNGAASNEIYDNIRILRIGTRSLFNYFVILFVLKNSKKYDLIIEDINKIPFFTPLFNKGLRLHMVMHFFGAAIFHEASFPVALYVYGAERLVPLIYRRERFIALSKSTADEIIAFTHNPLSVNVIEPGIALDFYCPGCKEEPPFLLYVGRIKRYKNVQFVIRCFEDLLSRFPDLTFRIVGTGDYLRQLAALIIHHKLLGKIRLYGFVSEKEKRELLRKATLFVNPSTKEGWGINNIEANLCGTISVSSRVAGLNDSVVDNVTGVLFEYNNKNDFVEKVSDLLRNKEKRQKMERNAVDFAKKFDWGVVAEKMENVLKEVL
ncbi:MAG: glycosyltransferase family 4 protein [Elusimicrobiota bacterium]